MSIRDTSNSDDTVKALSVQRLPRLLLIDDDDFTREIATIVLGQIALKTDTARNGREAIHLAVKNVYDVILIDLQMPLLDGFGVTAAIRNLPGFRGRTPIIAFTAHVMDEHIRRCLDAGMDDHIGKPFIFDELRGKVLKWAEVSSVNRACFSH